MDLGHHTSIRNDNAFGRNSEALALEQRLGRLDSLSTLMYGKGPPTCMQRHTFLRIPKMSMHFSQSMMQLGRLRGHTGPSSLLELLFFKLLMYSAHASPEPRSSFGGHLQIPPCSSTVQKEKLLYLRDSEEFVEEIHSPFSRNLNPIGLRQSPDNQ